MDARTRPAPTSPDGPRGPGSTAGGHDRPAGWIDRYLAAATRWLPAAEQIVLEGCGHVPQVERPERTNGLITRFFARIDALGAAAPARERVAA